MNANAPVSGLLASGFLALVSLAAPLVPAAGANGW